MSVQVGLLSTQQFNEIRGQEYAPDSFYNPVPCLYKTQTVQVISQEEMRDTVNERFLWVKDLPLIPYTPPLK
jgi:hypothetical protein